MISSVGRQLLLKGSGSVEIGELAPDQFSAVFGNVQSVQVVLPCGITKHILPSETQPKGRRTTYVLRNGDTRSIESP